MFVSGGKVVERLSSSSEDTERPVMLVEMEREPDRGAMIMIWCEYSEVPLGAVGRSLSCDYRAAVGGKWDEWL